VSRWQSLGYMSEVLTRRHARQDDIVVSITPYEPTEFGRVLQQTRECGWLVVDGNLRELALALRSEAERGAPPVEIVLGRSTDDDVQVLRPLTREDARPRSLSAQFGHSPFPFHTDGAHLQTPPEFMLLAAMRHDSGETPTHLKRMSVAPTPANEDDMRLGVFRVDSGRRSFYATCRSAGGRIRFDPGCMAAVDPRSRRLSAAIGALAPDYSHQWTRSDEIVIVDNTRVMHARGQVGVCSQRALYRLLLSTSGVGDDQR
jgi:hypothetical protein